MLNINIKHTYPQFWQLALVNLFFTAWLLNFLQYCVLCITCNYVLLPAIWTIFISYFSQQKSLTEAHREQKRRMKIFTAKQTEIPQIKKMDIKNYQYCLCLLMLSWFPYIDVNLAGRAGQRHPSLQLRQYLLLQSVQLVPPSSSSSSGRSIQFVAPSVHQVVVDVEQGLIMDLNKQIFIWVKNIYPYTSCT